MTENIESILFLFAFQVQEKRLADIYSDILRCTSNSKCCVDSYLVWSRQWCSNVFILEIQQKFQEIIADLDKKA